MERRFTCIEPCVQDWSRKPCHYDPLREEHEPGTMGVPDQNQEVAASRSRRFYVRQDHAGFKTDFYHFDPGDSQRATPRYRSLARIDCQSNAFSQSAIARPISSGESS
jgi:hypothetical protein